ncbi:MAG TPA: molybdopterin-dependent oxidoreductase, partial [Acidiferrobacteraceae bacterium]|nr:molybdopterin-dependent oxidoreductase [Acidiferrobacteraceae bacterium]
MLEASVRTVCPYCGVGCGLVAEATREGPELKGDRLHPANQGLLCSKGMALAETLGDETRLLAPLYRGQKVGWEEALTRAAEGLAATVRNYGPDAVAFYVSGQLLTEDYYVANKLMKGFIGSANIDTNSRLCMSSSVAGHVRAFGEDVVPACYEDLDLAELVVYAGSNAAWCHPVLHRRVLERREPPLRVVIDPRWTPTCEGALHLPLKPGSDVALWNGLLVHLHESACVHQEFVRAHTDGYQATLAAARLEAGSVSEVARHTGLTAEAVHHFFKLFERCPRVVTLYSQGVNQSSRGTDKVNAILNCHLATGRIGHPGMGPLSLTGQPNAMGGREVGGLANQLAAHRGFSVSEVDSVRRFWKAPHLATRPGLKAVELFEAVAEGRVRALWIMATNPVDSLPRADHVRAALKRCPLVIVSDCVAENDTLPWAHLCLPAQAFGEKSGMVTNSERRMSRQRPFLEPPPGPKPDWEIVCEVARRMGFGSAFAFRNTADIFREHAALTAHENGGTRLLDLSGVAKLTDAQYEQWQPRCWPVRAGCAERARLFGDGQFPTASGRAQLVPVHMRPPAVLPNDAFPLVLNTGRLRDQWHTTTRTGLSARLSRQARAPEICCHPQDAARAGIVDGDIAHIETPFGSLRARARVTAEVPAGSVFGAIHWTDTNCSGGRIGAL